MKLVNGIMALKLLEEGEKIYSEVQPCVSYYLEDNRLWFHNEKWDYKETSLLNRKDIINKYFYVKEEVINKYAEFKTINLKNLKENEIIINKGDKSMNKKVKVKIKTLEELLDTEGAIMEHGTISIKRNLETFTKEMRKFCGKELELEWQPALYFWGSYAVSKWMCSEWKEIDERKDKFNELKEGFALKGTNYDKRIKIIPNQKDLKYFDRKDNNLLLEIMFADCSTSISLGFDQWNELNNYVNKLKKLKNNKM